MEPVVSKNQITEDDSNVMAEFLAAKKAYSMI